MPVGGFSTTRPGLPHPLGAEAVTPSSSLWRIGELPVRTALCPGRRVHIIGPCGAAGEAVQDLTHRPLPPGVAWQWPGAYAVLEEVEHGLVLHTDPAAAMPLYAVIWGCTWAWSTSARHLAALAGKGIDTKRLACAVLAPSLPMLAGDRCFFTDVRQLPPGSRITLPANGGPSTCSTVWRPDPFTGPPPSLRLRNALTASVRLRVQADPALSSDLSGGLDSTTLSVLASRAMLNPINGVTIHPQDVLDGADLRYARLAAEASQGRIRHRLLALGDEHRPYTGLADVPVTDEPAPSTITQARLRAQLRWMHTALGTRTHLTGDGGDSVLFQPPARLADLVREHHYGQALREATGWARLRHTPVSPLLRDAARMAATTREEALAGLAAALNSGEKERRNRGNVEWFPTLPLPQWALPSAVRLLTRTVEEYAAAPDPLPGLDASVRTLVDEIREVARTAAADAELARTCGIDLHNPFLDSFVVDAVLRIPLTQRPPLYAYKPLLTRAFADVLPPALTARTTKGSFEADHYSGLRAALPELLDSAGTNLAALDLIDGRRFREQVRQAAAGVPMPLATIEQALTADAWLCAVAGSPEPEWILPTHRKVA
ncbi:albusnodin/ikarugamycin family macrolactam cyclase [Streptomyces erythrochromogenes]|uniref:albusnodin/ikarugamycin family macrolactam cyclase n=1 Tax=Streptomyces erythrochromogenes TaxID=285574 RepID=UPI0036B5E026